MEKSPNPDVLKATRGAVLKIRSFGIDGPRPIEEIDILFEHEAEVDEALQLTLHEAGPADITAAIHLVSVMKRTAVLDTVCEVVFTLPSGLDAKREAVKTMRRCDVEPDPDAIEKLAVIDSFVTDPDSETLAVVMEWPKAWRRPSLDAWLAGAGVDQLSAVEIAIGIDPDLDASFLDWIAAQGTSEAAEALQRFLASADDKDRVKQVRKALYRLRSQGIEIKETATEEKGGGTFSMAIGLESLEDARAYVTSIDGLGARLVCVVWRAPNGGSRLLQAVIDDTRGIKEAEVARVTRKGFREHVEKIQADSTVMLGQISVARAGTILADAAHKAVSAGRDLPSGYNRWAEVAGVEPAPAGPAEIYEHLSATEVGADAVLIEASMVLLRETCFQSWALKGTVIDSAAEEIHQAEISTLMISDEQRRERMQDAICVAVAESFDDTTREAYRCRLEVMAGMLWDHGRQEEARQALAAGIGLTEIRDLFRGHAFARAVVHRGVWLAYQDKQRELLAEQRRSAIVQP
jgi:hypothetical protein